MMLGLPIGKEMLPVRWTVIEELEQIHQISCGTEDGSTFFAFVYRVEVPNLR
jgi:hypothetical protein